MLVGGGQGRTPRVAVVLREFLAEADLLSYTEAILRVYNRHGRRDNKHKARIKILVAALGEAVFARQVEVEWEAMRTSALRLEPADIAAMQAHFAPPAYVALAPVDEAALLARATPGFARWYRRNTRAHRVPGYRAVYVSLARAGQAPARRHGDVLAGPGDAFSERFSFGELRVTHEQNVVLADVRADQLEALWQALDAQRLAAPNIGLLTDLICCPGLDFCSLANASSIPIAAAIQARFDDLDYLHDLGEIELKMSGCMNACGHHHVGHIGILGVDKNGAEFYQFPLGGVAGDGARLGERPGRPCAEVVNVRGSSPSISPNVRTVSASSTPSRASASRRSSTAPTRPRPEAAGMRVLLDGVVVDDAWVRDGDDAPPGAALLVAPEDLAARRAAGRRCGVLLATTAEVPALAMLADAPLVGIEFADSHTTGFVSRACCGAPATVATGALRRWRATRCSTSRAAVHPFEVAHDADGADRAGLETSRSSINLLPTSARPFPACAPAAPERRAPRAAWSRRIRGLARCRQPDLPGSCPCRPNNPMPAAVRARCA